MKPMSQPCHPERSEGPRIRLLLRYRVEAFSRYSRGIGRMPRIFFVSLGGSGVLRSAQDDRDVVKRSVPPIRTDQRYMSPLLSMT